MPEPIDRTDSRFDTVMVKSLIIPAVPRVSIITPSYNRGHLLSATLDSVLAQTYPDWEAIVVDDHSQDNTLEVARKLSAADPRVRPFLRRGDRKGANVCRNQGLEEARGEFVVFLDSDDLLSPSCLERRVARMDTSPDCQYGVYRTELFADRIGDRAVLWNVFTDANDLHRFLNLDIVWCTMSPIWRREALRQLGGFHENLLSFQDWALHTRALIAGLQYYKDPTVDNFCRHRHDGADQISAVSVSRADHLESHEKLFTNTCENISAAGKMDRETRIRLTGLFWWLARCWLKNRDSHQAAQVWRHVAAFNLCPRRHYLEGCLIIKCLSRRSEGRIAQTVQWSWPKPYHEFGSTSFFKAPVDPVSPTGTAPETQSARASAS